MYSRPANHPTPRSRRRKLGRHAVLPLIAAALMVATPAGAAPLTGLAPTAVGPTEGRYPDASTTGVPSGVTLQPSGSVTVTKDGTVLSGMDILGTVTVDADDVVIRDSRIRSTGPIPVRNRGTNLLIENTEIDGQGKLGPAVAYNQYTLRSVDIHNIGEGPRIAGGNVVIEGSFIHHLVQVGDNHTDALQAVSGKKNIVIRGNNIQVWNPDRRMYGNAAFQFGEEDGPVRDCLVEDNYMNGGNYTVNGGGGGTRGAACTFRNNSFGTDHRYGVSANLGPNVVWDSTNRYHDGPPPAAYGHEAGAAPENAPAPVPAPAPTAPTAPASSEVPSAEKTIERYIDAVYRDLFDRTPDAAGLRTWTEKLQRGTRRDAVANSITSSNEYRSKLIANSYHTYLNRGPDPSGLANWLTRMSRGMTIQQMEGGFLASSEYFNNAGRDNSRWVSALYGDVLGRRASAAEVRHWTDALSRGVGRTSVAAGFLLSAEHLTTVIDGHYRHLLRRTIDPSGRATWVRAIQTGTRVENVIGGIVGSDEYVNAAAR